MWVIVYSLAVGGCLCDGLLFWFWVVWVVLEWGETVYSVIEFDLHEWLHFVVALFRFLDFVLSGCRYWHPSFAVLCGSFRVLDFGVVSYWCDLICIS